jgi:hypothetical protein
MARNARAETPAAPASESLPGWLARLGADLSLRIQRSRVDRLIPGARPAIVAAWLACLVLAWVVTLPFIAVPDAGSAVGWVRAVVYVSIAGLTVVATVVAIAASSRTAGFPVATLALPVAIVVGNACPLIALGAAGSSITAGLAAGCTVAAATLATVMIVRRRPGAGWSALGAGIVGSVPWLLAAGLSASQPDDEAAALWLVVVTVGVEAATLATFYGFATAARSRVDRTGPVLAAAMSLQWVTVVVGAAALVIVARLTVVRAVFEDEYAFWAMRTWWSWPLSAVLGAGIAIMAIRSEHAPLEDRGFGELLGILVVGFAYPSILMTVWIVGEFIDDTVGWPQADLSSAVDAIPYVWAITSAATAVFLLHPRWRGTTARAVAAISVPYLLAGTLASEVDRLWPGGPAWWASPPPIVVSILLIVIVITVGQWRGRWTSVPRAALVRLAVFPVVVLQAVDLLPAFIDGHLQSIVAVLLLAAVIFLLLPPVASDRVRHTAVVGSATMGVLFALIGTVLSATSPDRNRVTLVLAMLMLSVPVMTALVLRSRSRQERHQLGGDDPHW